MTKRKGPEFWKAVHKKLFTFDDEGFCDDVKEMGRKMKKFITKLLDSAFTPSVKDESSSNSSPQGELLYFPEPHNKATKQIYLNVEKGGIRYMPDQVTRLIGVMEGMHPGMKKCLMEHRAAFQFWVSDVFRKIGRKAGVQSVRMDLHEYTQYESPVIQAISILLDHGSNYEKTQLALCVADTTLSLPQENEYVSKRIPLSSIQNREPLGKTTGVNEQFLQRVGSAQKEALGSVVGEVQKGIFLVLIEDPLEAF